MERWINKSWRLSFSGGGDQRDRISFSGGPAEVEPWREVATIADRREVAKGTGTRGVKSRETPYPKRFAH